MGFLKKITRPVTKVLDKIIPNEIKPFLPYVAAAAPFMAPALAGAGIGGQFFNTAMGRALLSGGLSAVASGAEEGSEGIDFKTALLSGGIGALTAPGVGDSLRGMTATGQTTKAGILEQLSKAPIGTNTGAGFFGTAKDMGLRTLAKGADFLTIGEGPLSLKDIAGKYAVTTTPEATGQAIRYTERLRDAEQAALDEFNRLQEENAAATYDDYYSNILKYMDLAGFTAEEAESAADRVLSGLFANGGRVGYNMGGTTNKDVTPPGMEMDLRVGGFIPIGKAERADDVKARVGLNEFVMTADAVRGMGNGDVREGARRMYQLMDKLEPIGRMKT